jgi:hypothetical protein
MKSTTKITNGIDKSLVRKRAMYELMIWGIEMKGMELFSDGRDRQPDTLR